MEPQELLNTLHETFKTINARIAALEIVHTRYQGPKGPKGDKGDSGPAGRDGKDSTELNTLRDERNQFRDELNTYRRELHDFRTALSTEMREMHEHAAAELARVYQQEVDAFCAMRDQAVGPQGPQGNPGPQGERGERGPVGPQGRPGDISAAVTQAEAEANRVVQEGLADIDQRLERLGRATK